MKHVYNQIIDRQKILESWRWSDRNAEESVAELIKLARDKKSARFDLGEIDFGSENLSPFLSKLDQLRQKQSFRFSLSCKIPHSVDREQVGMLHLAGVKFAEIAKSSFSEVALKSVGMERANLEQVQLVKYLHEIGIEVMWQVVLDEGNPEAFYATATLFESMHHLPPPKVVTRLPGLSRPLQEKASHCYESNPENRGVHGFVDDEEKDDDSEIKAGQAIAEAILKWHHTYRPHIFSFGRGPGFLRIFDRRKVGVGTFIILDGLQAETFMVAREARTFDEIAHAVPGVSGQELRRFLSELVARDIMCRTTDDYYLSLPTRRQLEENWVRGAP